MVLHFDGVYEIGKGVLKEDVEALKWYNIYAEHGEPMEWAEWLSIAE